MLPSVESLMTTTAATKFDIASELRALLKGIDLAPEDSGGKVTFAGEDPIFPSVHRLGAVGALALAANAVGIAAIWRMRTGRGQDISVDLRHAIHMLNVEYRHPSTLYGYGIPRLGEPRNPLSNGLFETRDGRTVCPTGTR